MPGTMVDNIHRSYVYHALKMETSEEPMNYFGHVDKIVGILVSLGEVKSVGDVYRKLLVVTTLSNDYEMEQRTILYDYLVS